MKHLLTKTPILRIVYPNKDFGVCIDASKEGLGGALTQEYHVICYESRKLKEHEKWCSTWYGVGNYYPCS